MNTALWIGVFGYALLAALVGVLAWMIVTGVLAWFKVDNDE